MEQVTDSEKSQDFAQQFKGFSRLSSAERFQRLQALGVLSPADIDYLKNGGISGIELGEKFIENVIGYMQLPLGVATNFRIDGRDLAIPMAVEETSIVAAASKTARWVRDEGYLETRTIGESIIGQIQVADCSNFEHFKNIVESKKEDLIEMANRQVASGMVKRGGGVRDIQVRSIQCENDQLMAVVHVYLDAKDAMGANIVNQVCEFLKIPLQALTGEKVTMCILSNLVDSKVTEAKVTLPNIDPELGEKIEQASLFAQVDPYRASTSNKGVLNGIDPILVATGNDWRAVEAGIHAFAARSGQYRSITQWKMRGKDLVGVFQAPIIVGTVGGVTQLHPTAKMCLEMMKIKEASDLARICAAVGLVQNLGAIKALSTVGIIAGHMKLHIKNLVMAVGATEKEAPALQKKLEEVLLSTGRISTRQAMDAIKEMRTKGHKVVVSS